MPEELGIKGSELGAYAVIWCFSKDGVGEFIGSWHTMASKIGVADETAGAALGRLIGKGLIARRCVMTPRGKSYHYWVTPQDTPHFPKTIAWRDRDDILATVPGASEETMENIVLNETGHLLYQGVYISNPSEQNYGFQGGKTMVSMDHNNNVKANALTSVRNQELTKTKPNESVRENTFGKTLGKSKAEPIVETETPVEMTRGTSDGGHDDNDPIGNHPSDSAKSHQSTRSKSKRKGKRGGKRGKKRECGPSAGQRRRERAMAMRSECESRKLENITEKEFDELFDFAERRWAEMEDAQPGRHEDKGTRFPTNEASERAFSRPTLDMLVGMCDGSVKTAKNCLKRMDFSGRKSISYVLKDTVENKDMMPPILKMAKGSGLCPCAVIPDPKW